MLLTKSTLVKGIDVKTALFVYEEAYKQYKTCSRANLDAKLKKQQIPYPKDYVDNALYAHVDAKVALENFIEYIQNIDELKGDLEMLKRYNDKQVPLLIPFIESLEKQAYMVPIAVDALRNLC